MNFWNAQTGGSQQKTPSSTQTQVSRETVKPVQSAPPPVQSAPPPSAQARGAAATAFRRFDKDGSGYITRDEAHSVLSKYLGFSAAQSKAMLDDCDVNNDGKLSYREFAEFYDKIKAK